jgi:hypothetical protein
MHASVQSSITILSILKAPIIRDHRLGLGEARCLEEWAGEALLGRMDKELGMVAELGLLELVRCNQFTSC